MKNETCEFQNLPFLVHLKMHSFYFIYLLSQLLKLSFNNQHSFYRYIIKLCEIYFYKI
jgi:hypothetical protein